jgi:hypothetical protein
VLDSPRLQLCTDNPVPIVTGIELSYTPPVAAVHVLAPTAVQPSDVSHHQSPSDRRRIATRKLELSPAGVPVDVWSTAVPPIVPIRDVKAVFAAGLVTTDVGGAVSYTNVIDTEFDTFPASSNALTVYTYVWLCTHAMFDDCHTAHVPLLFPQPAALSHATFQPLDPVHVSPVTCAGVSQCPDVLVAKTHVCAPLLYVSWYSTRAIGAWPGVDKPVIVANAPPMLFGVFTVGVVIDTVGSELGLLYMKYRTYFGVPCVPVKHAGDVYGVAIEQLPVVS